MKVVGKKKPGDIQRDYKMWAERNWGHAECPECSLLVIAQLPSPILYTQCPDFRVGVRALDWKGCRDHWWDISRVGWWLVLTCWRSFHHLLATACCIRRLLLKETLGRRWGSFRAPASPVGYLTSSTGRRKPFLEGLGRASSKQQNRTDLFPTVFPCGQVRLCPGEETVCCEKLYVAKDRFSRSTSWVEEMTTLHSRGFSCIPVKP